jgi:hypothetical protein
MTFKQEYEAMKRAKLTKEKPAAMATGCFDDTIKMKPVKTAANMEARIDEYCTLNNAECTKVYAGGRHIVSKTKAHDVLGRERNIINEKYIPGTTRPGTSDLIIVKNNKSLYVEVKFSKSDRQAEVQKAWQARVESYGNTYEIVKTLDEFQQIFKKYYYG